MTAPTPSADETMRHLGAVLSMLAELHDDDRCDAFDAALAHYNEHNPNHQVVPVEGHSTRLVHIGPLEAALAAARAQR